MYCCLWEQAQYGETQLPASHFLPSGCFWGGLGDASGVSPADRAPHCPVSLKEFKDQASPGTCDSLFK